MTAIFAYVTADIAFIAGDTLRVDPSGLLPPMTICKIHYWSESVIFGQAGSQHQSSMISEMKLKKKQYTDPKTGNIYFDDSEHWLFQSFNSCQSIHYPRALAASGPILSQGSVFVASPNPAGELFCYDFASGSRSIIGGSIAAGGTNPALFLGSAQRHMTTLGAAGSKSLPLDQWAKMCLTDAIAACPATVGWPADLLISRPDGLGGRILVQRRIDSNSTCAHPDFTS